MEAEKVLLKPERSNFFYEHMFQNNSDLFRSMIAKMIQRSGCLKDRVYNQILT